MVGNVGADVLGTQLRDGLIRAGVDTVCLNTMEEPLGAALITSGGRGENNIVVVPGANGFFIPELLETRIILVVVFLLPVYTIVKLCGRATDVGREPAQVYGSTQIEDDSTD